MMKARIVLSLCFMLMCGLGYGQQAGLKLKMWGRFITSGSIDQPVRKVVTCQGTVLALLYDSTLVAWGDNRWAQCEIPDGLNGIVDIAVGCSHSMALKRDGTVITWGDTTNGISKVPLGLRQVKAISAGCSHGLALKTDGTVVAWGDNNSGQVDVPQNLGGVVKISASGYVSLALLSDRTVVGWGQLAHSGYPITTHPVPVPSPRGIVDIAAGRDFSTFLMADSTVKGSDLYGFFDLSRFGFTGVAKIACSGSGFGAVKYDGTVVVRRYNSTDSVNQFYRELSDIKDICTGSETMAIRANGALVSWRLDPRYTNRAGYIPSRLTRLVDVDAANSYNGGFILAINDDRRVVAWGDNYYGQCNIPPNLTNVVSVAAGSSHSLALRADGKVVAWGNNNAEECNIPVGLSDVVKIEASCGYSLALKRNGQMVAWGKGRFGTTYATPSLSNIISISAGDVHFLALKADSTVVAWGDNFYGQLNVPSGLSKVIAIAASGGHSLALKSDGTVVAWGDNGTGQSTVPLGLANVVKISATLDDSYALKSDENLVAWGSHGQYGATRPTFLPLTKALTAGQYMLVALQGYLENVTPRIVSGNVSRSINSNCIQDSVGAPIPFQAIQALPGPYYGFSNTTGRYTINVDSGNYQVSQVLNSDQALLQRQICPPNNAGYTASFAGRVDTVSGLNFANDELACPRLEVQVSSNRRRRCFKNSTVIKYANSGYAAQAGVVAHLKLPRYVVFKSATMAYTFIASDSSYAFDLGTLAAGQSGQINILDSVLCVNGIRGLQQCTKAWLTPGIQPCQWPAGYDGSNIDVKGKCTNNQVTFKLKNLGRAMSRGRGYKVYSDSVLAFQGTYNLTAGDSTVLTFPPASRTSVLRLEAKLDSLSPYGRFAYDVASCGPILTSIGEEIGRAHV